MVSSCTNPIRSISRTTDLEMAAGCVAGSFARPCAWRSSRRASTAEIVLVFLAIGSNPRKGRGSTRRREVAKKKRIGLKIYRQGRQGAKSAKGRQEKIGG